MLFGTISLTASPAFAGGTNIPPGKIKSEEVIHSMPLVPTVQHAGKGARSSRPNTRNLQYRGGSVERAQKIYLVFWGSQWSNDPNGEASYLQNFYNGLYGAQDTWSTSTVQYCQGASYGSTSCSSSASFISHPGSSPLAGVWFDNGAAAPSSPTQNNLAGEAVNAAGHFGNTSSASNTNVQYVVATAHGNNMNGFATQWCAWHSSASSNYGSIAYTNLPYIPDAGYSCGANFVNAGVAGALDGVSIVGGHEYVETVTDPFPNSGWLDRNGEENADKCIWISPGTSGGAANLTLSTGTFAVQSLWSNNFNGGNGGCAIYYASASNQHG
jgi:hypothetical protein